MELLRTAFDLEVIQGMKYCKFLFWHQLVLIIPNYLVLIIQTGSYSHCKLCSCPCLTVSKCLLTNNFALTFPPPHSRKTRQRQFVSSSHQDNILTRCNSRASLEITNFLVKMNYILLTFLVTVRCSAYNGLDRSSLHRQDHLHSRQDSPSSPLELSDYFVPVVAISFFTSLFTSIGKFDLPAIH